MSWLPLLLACASSADDSGGPCAEPVPTWDNGGQAFFAQWCDSCHAESSPNRYGAPEGVHFDTLDDVAAWTDRLDARVLQDATMPPGGGIAEDELDLFATFLECSLPE